MDFYAKSDKGLRREENQDVFITCEPIEGMLLLIVCDGMGGANGGKVASELCGESFAKTIDERINGSENERQIRFGFDKSAIPEILREGVNAANTAVHKKATRSKKLAGMGTTLVSALIYGNTLYGVNVGDSRLYSVKDGRLLQLSHDHSYVQTLVDLGTLTPEQARKNPHKNIITKAIGIGKEVEPDIFSKELNGEEYLLLCSDGLSGYVEEDRILDVILEKKEPSEICSSLIDEANANGGGDNITLCVIRL